MSIEKTSGRKAVPEPYRSANAQWYANALQEFWRKNEKAKVEDVGNEDYKGKNVGGGKTRGENAHIIFSNGTISIKDIKCKDSKMGDCIWFFNVKSQGSKGSMENYRPVIKLQHSQETSHYVGSQEHTIATAGKVTSWECQCSDFKYRKSVCKHILASTIAMWSRITGVQSGRIQ